MDIHTMVLVVKIAHLVIPALCLVMIFAGRSTGAARTEKRARRRRPREGSRRRRRDYSGQIIAIGYAKVTPGGPAVGRG